MSTTSPTTRFITNYPAGRLDMLDAHDGGVQGAWWPRTRQLSNELSDLNDLLIGKHGLMHSVTCVATDWDETETGQVRATTAGSFVRLTASTTLAKHTVLVHTLHNQSIRLLVVPPSFDQNQARWAVRLMLQSNGRQSAAEILRGCQSVSAS